MQLTDHRDIAAPTATVWSAILDPDVLKSCIPGCESMTGSPEDGFEAVVVQKVGPVKARFTGLVHLSDMVPEQGLTISGEGKGGPAGFAKGSARVELAPEGAGTRLTYTVDASVGGKLAQLGSRIIDGFAKKMADQFFENFKMALEPPAPEELAEAGDEAGDGTATEQKKGWFKRTFGG